MKLNAQLNDCYYLFHTDDKKFSEVFSKKTINELLYIEKDIFKRISTNIVFFKDIENQIIYILNGKKRKVFFSKKQSNIELVYNKEIFLLHWEKTLQKTSNGNVIYKLLIRPKKIYVTHLSYYYFTFEDGVIAIEGYDFILKRNGFEYIDFNKI